MKQAVELGSIISPAKTVRCGDRKYPVLSMTMHNGLVFQDEKFKKVIASKDTSDYKVVYRNQLVISFPIDEGVLAAQRITDAGIVSPAYGIWDIDQTRVLPEFLELALRCNRALQYYKAKLRGSTARRRSLPTPTLLAFSVPMPDLEEQQEILDIVHNAKQLVALREQELQSLDELIKARFVEMFGDPVINPRDYPVRFMSEIAEYWNGLIYKPEDVSEEGTIVLRSSNIQNMQLDFTDIVRVSCDIGSKKFVKDNDILMCSRNGSAKLVGKVALIHGSHEPMSFGAFMMIIRSAYYPYLMTFFQLPAFRSQITTGATTTINQITGSMMNKVMLPVPDKATVNEFAAFVTQVNKSKAAVQKSLDEAQVLFDSLMQEYFG